MKPLIFLDVDGPLNPWASGSGVRPDGYVEHQFRLSWWRKRPVLRMWLNAAHGPALIGLAQRTGAQRR